MLWFLVIKNQLLLRQIQPTLQLLQIKLSLKKNLLQETYLNFSKTISLKTFLVITIWNKNHSSFQNHNSLLSAKWNKKIIQWMNNNTSIVIHNKNLHFRSNVHIARNSSARHQQWIIMLEAILEINLLIVDSATNHLAKKETEISMKGKCMQSNILKWLWFNSNSKWNGKWCSHRFSSSLLPWFNNSNSNSMNLHCIKTQ